MKYVVTALVLCLLILFFTYEETDREICLISYNIKYDNRQEGENSWSGRKDELIQLLDDYNPDIFGIQEGLAHQVKEIQKALGPMSYVGVGRDDGHEKGEYCALFYDTTRYQVMNSSTFWLSETPDTISVGWDAALERICTMALFEDRSSSQRLWVLNTHFDHVGKDARVQSARLISSRVKELQKDGYPVILMGDLNAKPGERPITILGEVMNDALSISRKPLEGPEGTYNGFQDVISSNRIDYFFASTIAIESYEHVDRLLKDGGQISDHQAVVIKAKFDWDF